MEQQNLNAPPTNTDGAVVFLCYAREDQAFALKLADVLRQHHVQVVGDWLLVRGESYEEQLRDLQLAADTLLFILSPASIRSGACHAECSTAAEQRKRILPVLYREVEIADTELRSELAKPQWTYMRESDEFAASVAALLDALNTDFDLLPEHRRLLQTAETWQRSGRSRSYLLRKEALNRSEAWLLQTSRSAKRIPAPTPLQLDYVQASRRARTRGTRVALGVVGAIAVAMAGLAFVALGQRNEAERQANDARIQEQRANENAALAKASSDEASQQRDEADRQRDEANKQRDEANRQRDAARNARELAETRRAEAERQRNAAVAGRLAAEAELASLAGGPMIERSLLLAIHSARLGLTPASYALLQRGVSLMPPLLSQFPADGEDRVSKMVVGVSGYIATIVGRRSVVVWDVRRGVSTARMEHTTGVLALDFSLDGKSLATGDEDGVTMIFDAQSGRVRFRVRGEGGVQSLSFSRDGRYLAAGWNKGSAKVIDVANGVEVMQVRHDRGVLRVALSSNAKRLGTLGGDRTVRVWDVISGRQLNPTSHASDSADNGFDDASGALTALLRDQIVWAVTPGTQRPFLSSQISEYAAWSRDSSLVAVLSIDHRLLRVLAATSREELWRTPLTAESQTTGSTGPFVSFSPNGRYLAAARGDGTVRLYDVSSHEEVSRVASVASAIAFDPDNRYLAILSEGKLKVFEVPEVERLDLLRKGETHRSAAIGPDGRAFAVGTFDGIVRAVPSDRGRVVSLTVKELNSLSFSGDGRTLFVGALRDWRLVRVDTNAIGSAFKPPDAMISASLSRDGRTVASIGLTFFRVTDVPTAKERTMFPIPGSIRQLSALVAVGVGGKYAVTAEGNDVRLWSIDRRANLASRGLNARVMALAFSRDGRYVAASTMANTVHLFDLTTGFSEVGRFDVHAPLVSMAFSDDNKRLHLAEITSDDQNRVLIEHRLWQTDDLIEAACARVTRNLELQEVINYLGRVQAYTRGCPNLSDDVMLWIELERRR